MLVSATAVASAAAAKALAEPLRWRILQLLGSEQLCTCHLQEELGVGQTLVSHHLRSLREAGLVTGEPCGRYTYYRLVPGALDVLADAVGGLAAAARTDAPRRAC